MAEEVLSRALSGSVVRGRLTPTFPTHVLYADDIMIFSTGLKSNIWELISIFNKYSAISGQIVNNSKSRFFIGSMSITRINVIANMLGFSVGTVPFLYL